MMQKPYFFNPNGQSMEKPMVIMLSGLPCTGKSSWRGQFIKAAQAVNLPVHVVCADDLAFQLRDEWNATKPAETPFTYQAICETHRQVLDTRYQDELQKAMGKPGIVILDRTYLTAARRGDVLKLIQSAAVHCVHFVIKDKPAWEKKLKQRNEGEQEKQITDNILDKLGENALLPDIDEGFASVMSCPAVSEENWQDGLKLTIHELITGYQTATKSPAPHCQ